MSEIETLQDRIKHDQVDYEKQRNEYEQQIQRKKEHVEYLKGEYVRLVKEISSKAVFSRSGKAISNQVFDMSRNFSLVGTLGSGKLFSIITRKRRRIDQSRKRSVFHFKGEYCLFRHGMKILV